MSAMFESAEESTLYEEAKTTQGKNRLPDGLTPEQMAVLWDKFGNFHYPSVVSPLLCDVESACGHDETVILGTKVPPEAAALLLALRSARWSRMQEEHIEIRERYRQRPSISNLANLSIGHILPDYY